MGLAVDVMSINGYSRLCYVNQLRNCLHLVFHGENKHFVILEQVEAQTGRYEKLSNFGLFVSPFLFSS